MNYEEMYNAMNYQEDTLTQEEKDFLESCSEEMNYLITEAERLVHV